MAWEEFIRRCSIGALVIGLVVAATCAAAQDASKSGKATVPMTAKPLSGVPMVQAEDLAAQGGGRVRIRSDKLGSVGKAFSHWDAEGHWIEWKVAIPQTADYYLVVRYCAPHDTRRSLLVDGEAQPGVELLEFPSSGGYGGRSSDCWVHLPVRNANGKLHVWRLQKGPHTIRMANVGAKGLNLDYLAFVPCAD